MQRPSQLLVEKYSKKFGGGISVDLEFLQDEGGEGWSRVSFPEDYD